MEFTVSSTAIVEFLGFIVALGGAGAVIYKIIKPIKDTHKKIIEHEERLEKGNKRFEEISDMAKMQCRCMLALIDHEITGNGIDKLKAIKVELQDFLIENNGKE